jgi:hypothetical protein
MPLAVLALVLALGQAETTLLTLDVRVFNGAEDVTRETRVTVHRTGERGQPLAQVGPGHRRQAVRVPPGLYDAQAVRERDGRVVNIRWAQRLVVMPYPDEHGHHLEVINFASGYGALQIRSRAPEHPPDVELYAPGQRTRPLPGTHAAGSLLFVVPAGHYDVHVRQGDHPVWHPRIEVPLDRTRMWVVP